MGVGGDGLDDPGICVFDLWIAIALHDLVLAGLYQIVLFAVDDWMRVPIHTIVADLSLP